MDRVILKKEILAEIGKLYSSRSLEKLVDLYLGIMLVQSDHKELAGVEERQYLAFCKVFDEDATTSNIKVCLSDVMKIEPMLKKILSLVNENDYNIIHTQKLGLIQVISKLGLNPRNERLDVNPDNYANSYLEHVARAYSLRNSESHTYENWTRREIYTNLDSVIICCLKAIEINIRAIESKLKENELLSELDIDLYLHDVVNQFKARMARFIHIRGEENFSFLERYVIENQDEESESKRRKGTVEQLRDSSIPERRMLLWGEAGMGKTTTLEYLSYIDAKKRISDSNANIPVMVALGLLTRSADTIKQYICDRLNITTETCENLLNEGKINLFLDGLNEIPNDSSGTLRTLRMREIKKFIKDYPKTFIIITNRPQDSKEFYDVPIFNLMKLSVEEIQEFVTKNVDDKSVRALIADRIKESERFVQIINTPLILSRLIEIVKYTKKIPTSEGEIIASFLNCLFEREKVDKQDAKLDVKRVTYLLRMIAFESLENKAANSGMTEAEMLRYCKKSMEEYSFSYDALYAIEISLQLGILEKKDDLYVFSHQAYQDHYYALEEIAVITS